MAKRKSFSVKQKAQQAKFKKAALGCERVMAMKISEGSTKSGHPLKIYGACMRTALKKKRR